MSKGLKLYIDFISPPCRSLYILLKQSGLPFDKVLIDLGKGEQFTNEYKQLNRFQKVPCIAEADFKLSESLAILRYLASSNRVSEQLYGGNKQKLARIDEFLQWHYTLRRANMNFFHLNWLVPYRTGQPSPTDELNAARKDMDSTFDIVENTWLKDSSKCLVHNEITAADIFGASEVQQTILSKYDVENKYPKISRWIGSVRERTAPHFDDAHKVLHKIANLSKDSYKKEAS